MRLRQSLEQEPSLSNRDLRTTAYTVDTTTTILGSFPDLKTVCLFIWRGPTPASVGTLFADCALSPLPPTIAFMLFSRSLKATAHADWCVLFILSGPFFGARLRFPPCSQLSGLFPTCACVPPLFIVARHSFLSVANVSGLGQGNLRMGSEVVHRGQVGLLIVWHAGVTGECSVHQSPLTLLVLFPLPHRALSPRI